MGETPEQKKAQEERYWALRGGKPPTVFNPNKEAGADTQRHPSAMSGKLGKAPKASRKPKDPSAELGELQRLLDEGKGSKQVPHTAKGLYYHFCDAVRKRWPEAQLDDLFGPSGRPNGKILKFAAILLSNYKTTDLFEMIQVLVDDYEAFSDSRMFLHYKGAPNPHFAQFYLSASTFKALIGKGVTGPNIRFSNYLRGYRERYPAPETSSASDSAGAPSPGSTKPGSDAPIDPDENPAVRALREKFNK